MSRGATLSVMGLYNWDPTLFDLMMIPSVLDKPLLINNLIVETAELEVLYPNPVLLKSLIGAWSAKQLSVWQHLYETTGYVYDPIENYNRREEGSQSGTGSTVHSGTDRSTETAAHTGTDTRTDTKTTSGRDVLDMTRRDGGTETEQAASSSEQGGRDVTSGTDKKEHYVAGFNPGTPSAGDDGLFKSARDEDTLNHGVSYGKTEAGQGSLTTTFGKTETNQDATTYGKTETETDAQTYGSTVTKNGSLTHGEEVTTENEGGHTLHAHGNIGVTTTQQLIKEEREIALFNIYDIIIEDFKKRFCLLVY